MPAPTAAKKRGRPKRGEVRPPPQPKRLELQPARTPEHPLLDILVIAVCTLLCGGEGFNDIEDFGEVKHDWLKTFLKLRCGIPSHDTFKRVFQALDPASFLECFVRWTPRACAPP